MRLLPGGNADPDFGGTGIVTWSAVDGIGSLNIHQLNSRHSDGASLENILFVNNHYLLSGYYFTGEFYMCFMIMLNEDGTMHSGFGNNGILYFDLNPLHNDKIIDAEFSNDKIILLADVTDDYADEDYILKIIDTNGIILSSFIYDVNGNSDVPKDLLTDPFGKLIISGYSLTAANASPGYDSDYFTMIALNSDFTPAGNFSVNGNYTETIQNIECGTRSICNSINNTVVAGGYTNSSVPGNFTDIAIIRIHNQAGNLSAEEINLPGMNVFPNPASMKIAIDFPENTGEITIGLYDLSGKLVINTSFSAPDSGVSIAIDQLPAGMYILKAVSGENRFIRKISKQ